MKIEFTEIGMIEIESLHSQILDDISNLSENTYILDFSIVEVITLPAIQLINSLVKYCEKCHIELKCINIDSSKIDNVLNTYNIKNLFGTI